MLDLSSVVTSAVYHMFLLICGELWLCWIVVRRVLFDSIASPARAGPWLYPLPCFREIDMLQLDCS